jgi:hypothetical protein
MERILNFLIKNDKESRNTAEVELNLFRANNPDEFCREMMELLKSLEEEDKTPDFISLETILGKSLANHLRRL